MVFLKLKDLIFQQDTNDNLHFFWNTKSANLSIIDEEAKKIQTAIEQCSNSFNILTDEEKDTVDKTSMLQETLNNCNSELTKGVDASKGFAAAQKKVEANATSAKRDVASYSGALKSMGNVAKSVGATLLNMGAALVVSFAISSLINWISELASHTETIREQAAEAAGETDGALADLEAQKAKVLELRQALDEGNLSNQEAYNTRRELYGIQQQMIESYGAEAAGINLVTGSVQSLSSAFDKLSEKELRDWYRDNAEGAESTVSKYMGTEMLSQDEDINWSLQNMTDQANVSTVTRGLQNILESLDIEAFNIDGNLIRASTGESLQKLGKNSLDRIRTLETLFEKIQLYERELASSGVSVNFDNIYQDLEKTIKDLKGENFDEEMLTLELHARYKISQDSAVNELYTELEKARAEYDQALASNDEKAVKASVKKITDLQAQLSNLEIEDSSVRNFLDSYIEMCNDYLGENKLKVDIEVNRDGLYDSLAIAVRNFGNGERVSAADILNFTPGSDTLSGGGSDYVKRQTKEAGYNALKTAADEAGISMQALTDTLIAFGLVEGEITQKAVSFTALSESFQNASAQLDNVQAAYKSVQSVLSDYNETGVLTIDHLQTLLSLGDEYLLSMVDENGQLQLNENAYKRLALAKLDKIKADMLDNAIGNLNALENEAAAAEYLKTKTDEAAESKYNLYLATLQEKQAQGGDVAKAANQIDSEVQRMLALFGQTAAGIETNTGLSLGGAQATNAYREALESEKNALEQTKTALENKKQALEDMKAAYEEDKQSIQSLIDLTMEMQKKQYETQKEQLENEKEAIREKVDLLKENLHAEKELHDYKKSLEEKTDEITTIEQQLSALGVRDDPEALKRRDELNEELNQARDELTELQYEREMELKEQQLENMYALEEEALDKEIEKIDTILGEEGTLREEAMQLIDGKSQAFYEQLSAYVSTYTTKSNAELQILWNNAYLALDKYTQGHYNTMAVMNLLDWNISKTDQKIANMNVQISQTGNAIATVSSRISSLAGSISNYAKALNEMTGAQKKAGEIAPQLKNYEGYFFGIQYQATAATAREAAQAIRTKMHTNYGGNIKNIMSVDEIEKRLTTYASGTKHAKGGLAIKDENGYELTLDRPVAGRYAVLNEGAVVFTREQTEKLWALSKNPVRFLSPILAGTGAAANIARSTSTVDNRSQVINQSATIHVHGNATPGGVNALYSNIEKKLFRSFRKILK